MEILENAARVLQALGYERMNAACVCGAEVVNPKVQSNLDAKALTEMTQRWEPYGMQVCGPVGLDLAVSEAACRHKHFTAPGAGQADILLVPTYEVGNGIGKAMSLFGGAKNAGIILGAKVPVVRPCDVLHQIPKGTLRIIQNANAGIDDLCQIVGRNVGGHTDGNAG